MFVGSEGVCLLTDQGFEALDGLPGFVDFCNQQQVALFQSVGLLGVAENLFVVAADLHIVVGDLLFEHVDSLLDQVMFDGQRADFRIDHEFLLTVVVGLETETPGSAGHTGGGLPYLCGNPSVGSSIPVW